MIEDFEIIEDIKTDENLENNKEAKLDHFHFVIFWNEWYTIFTLYYSEIYVFKLLWNYNLK